MINPSTPIDVRVRHTVIKILKCKHRLLKEIQNLYRGRITAYNIYVLIKQKAKEICSKTGRVLGHHARRVDFLLVIDLKR